LLTRRNAGGAFPGDDPQPPIAGWPGRQVQNLRYTYDSAGNIVHIQDNAQQTIYFRNKRVEPSNDYVYDALYRLIQADGREHLGQLDGGECKPPTAPDGFNAFHTRLDHPGNGQAMGTYTERYVYDAVGNFLQMQHRGTDPAHPGWTRAYDYLEPSLIEDGSPGTVLKTSNRLTCTTLNPAGNAQQPETYLHDAHGNMIHMPHLKPGPLGTRPPNMFWDYKDLLCRVDRSGGSAAFFVYDASGQRVRKVWQKAPGFTEERIYLGGFEIFRRHSGPIGANTATLERETLHVMDDKQRIALVETRTFDAGGNDQAPRQLIRYQFGNHLGSASLELDAGAQIISYEEYAPYGSSTYQAVRSQTETTKRYRYTGKERDEESGLYYHGARYYAPWLMLWSSCDTLGIAGGRNLYLYAAGNPVMLRDSSGLAPELTSLEAAAIAEQSGVTALVAKYSSVDRVIDVTPFAKNVSTNGVDAHLVVGSGRGAVNVIGDVKHSNVPSATGGSHMFSGEAGGRISSFQNAAKNDYGQLVRNLRAARASGTLDPATAYHAIESAKAGEVINEVVPSGYNSAVSKAVVEKYQASVTPNDVFAEAAAQREGLQLKEVTKGYKLGKQANPETVFKNFKKATAQASAKPATAAGGSAPASTTAELGSATKARAPSSAVPKVGVAGQVLRGLGTIAAVGGSLAGGMQVGTGVDKMLNGKVGEGAVDVGEGSANLGLSIGTTAAVKAGVITTEAGLAAGALTVGAGLAAAGSVLLVAETARAAVKGGETPIDIADKFYGTHFGDIYGWVTGAYSSR
jgi:RHS repeat-associated protein